MTDVQKKTTTPFVLIIVAFFTIRWGGDFLWRQISPYFAYAFEIGFVIYSYRYLKLRPILSIPSRDFLIVVPLGLVGYLAHDYAIKWSLPVPFDFSSYETLFLLLFFGPVLEEFLFRGALWELARKFLIHSPFKNQTNAWLILKTSGWFALGHLLSFFFVPQEYHTFIFYQTGYTFLLGTILGYRLTKGATIGVMILGHMAFNFGFYVHTMAGN